MVIFENQHDFTRYANTMRSTAIALHYNMIIEKAIK